MASAPPPLQAKAWLLDAASIAAAAGAEAAPASKRPRNGPDALDELIERARRIGLLDPLGIELQELTPFELRLQDRQRQAARRSWDVKRTATALRWFEGYCLAAKVGFDSGRPVFVPAFQLEGQVRNRATLDRFARFVRDSAPMRGGAEAVSADTIASYVGAIRLLVSREAGYDIAPESVDLISKLASKDMRKTDPHARGNREWRRPVRLPDFAAAATAGFDRGSLQGCVDWAAGLTAHNTISRGGELGCQDGVSPDAPEVKRRLITFASLEWQPPCEASFWRLWLLLFLIPIKDQNCRFRGYPTPIVRRHDGPLGTDPLCTYDALLLAFWRRRALAGELPPLDFRGAPADGWWLSPPARRQQPFAADADPFFTKNNVIWRTGDSRELFRRICRVGGAADWESAGASSGRSGGATDLKARQGPGSEQLIKDRGRWDSDVGDIYARDSLDTQIQTSLDIGLAGGTDLESYVKGRWVQRAVTAARR